uniref:Uncharacterized protein n=1 Tax=Meloidogyne enterolobii TaxID=390850 RepID=A0A6V7UN40_MELEN|nr:unnamed protein product [Meloidogyne enterolobii]
MSNFVGSREEDYLDLSANCSSRLDFVNNDIWDGLFSLQTDSRFKLLHIPSRMCSENNWLLRISMGILSSLREGKQKSNRLRQFLM